ncbi:MAG TPA: oligosaccharide flippase family protein, partial [Sphingomonas sanguinis]|nr:oligosaccharide flippase family protein [Sphingomonas sanguinis]
MIDALDDERSIFDPVNTQLRARVASGVSVTAALQGLRVVLQMASVVVLSRLLLPSDFGVVAMTSPVLGFMMIFQDLGLSQAAVQRRILTQRQASTLYWLNVV